MTDSLELILLAYSGDRQPVAVASPTDSHFILTGPLSMVQIVMEFPQCIVRAPV